jgi:hypothetical protein
MALSKWRAHSSVSGLSTIDVIARALAPPTVDVEVEDASHFSA